MWMVIKKQLKRWLPSGIIYQSCTEVLGWGCVTTPAKGDLTWIALWRSLFCFLLCIKTFKMTKFLIYCLSELSQIRWNQFFLPHLFPSLLNIILNSYASSCVPNSRIDFSELVKWSLNVCKSSASFIVTSFII